MFNLMTTVIEYSKIFILLRELYNVKIFCQKYKNSIFDEFFKYFGFALIKM